MDFQKFQMAGDFSAIQLVNILVHIFPHSTFLEVQQNIFCHICAKMPPFPNPFPQDLRRCCHSWPAARSIDLLKTWEMWEIWVGRSYTPRKLSRKEPQHKMEVGWFRGSSSRFQNSKIMVISAEDSPTYGSPYPFGWLDHNVGHFTQPPNDCFADIAQQLPGGFVWALKRCPCCRVELQSSLNHLWLVQRYAVLYKMGPVRPTKQMGWSGAPTNWPYKWVTGVITPIKWSYLPNSPKHLTKMDCLEDNPFLGDGMVFFRFLRQCVAFQVCYDF